MEELIFRYQDWYVIAFGLILGSFANVVIHRVPLGQSVFFPRSRCPHCFKPVSWYDNIPVLGYLFLLGRCRKCKARIKLRYPIVEILMAALFYFSFKKVGPTPQLFFRDWPLMFGLVAITFIDIDHRIIPDRFSIGGIVLGIATCWMVPDLGWALSLIGAGIGFGVFFGFSWVYYKISGKIGLGGGDIKFLSMVGAFLGPHAIFSTILISSVFGSIVGIAWLLYQKGTSKGILKEAIPYGPFLVMGMLFEYFYPGMIWHQYMIPM